MSEYSRPLGDTVKKARKKMGLTQNQVASIIGADERTIMNIETYKANTTMEVLYPLIRTLHIDARDIFNPEIRKDAPSHYQLRVLIDSCSEEETETLISVCEAVLSGLRAQNSIKIEEKNLPPFDREAGSAFDRLAHLLSTIFRFMTLMGISFLHFMQYRGKLTSTVFAYTFVRVFLPHRGQGIQKDGLSFSSNT